MSSQSLDIGDENLKLMVATKTVQSKYGIVCTYLYESFIKLFKSIDKTTNLVYNILKFDING